MDSWGKSERMTEVVEGGCTEPDLDLLNLAPHVVTALCGYETEIPTNHVLLQNLSKGSLTMTRVLRKSSYIRRWAEFTPDVTVIGLGACDIITEGRQFRDPACDFPKVMLDFLKTLREEATLHMSVSKWLWWSQHHRFLIIRPSDWADFHSSRAIVSAVDYRRVRRLIGRGLKRHAARFYKEAGAVVVAPRVECTTVEGVHLAPASQAQYNAQVVQGVARMVCRDCKLPQLYLNRSYRNILGETLCHLRPPPGKAHYGTGMRKDGEGG